MRNILEELWYGNIAPAEQSSHDDAQIAELLQLVDKNRNDLCATLTEKQKETFEKFSDCMFEMAALYERDAFLYGFRLGTKITAEGIAFEIPE